MQFFFSYFPPALIGSVDAEGPLSVLATFQYAHLQFQVRFLSFTKETSWHSFTCDGKGSSPGTMSRSLEV